MRRLTFGDVALEGFPRNGTDSVQVVLHSGKGMQELSVTRSEWESLERERQERVRLVAEAKRLRAENEELRAKNGAFARACHGG